MFILRHYVGRVTLASRKPDSFFIFYHDFSIMAVLLVWANQGHHHLPIHSSRPRRRVPFGVVRAVTNTCSLPSSVQKATVHVSETQKGKKEKKNTKPTPTAKTCAALHCNKFPTVAFPSHWIGTARHAVYNWRPTVRGLASIFGDMVVLGEVIAARSKYSFY